MSISLTPDLQANFLENLATLGSKLFCKTHLTLKLLRVPLGESTFEKRFSRVDVATVPGVLWYTHFLEEFYSTVQKVPELP